VSAHRGRALVTGAAGFIGVHLCRALAAAGWRVHALLRPEGSAWRSRALPRDAVRHAVDLADYAALASTLARVRPDVVFHAAAASAYAPQAPLRRMVADDVLTTVHLLDATAELPLSRLVVFASCFETGPGGEPHREDDAPRPTTRRGAARGAATLFALQQARGEGRPVVALRPFHVYGPWEAPRRLVPQAVRAALTGGVLPLAADDVERDLVYVGDVADACLLAATRNDVAGELIHLAGGRGVNAGEVAAVVERLTGRPLRVARGAYAGDGAVEPRRVADVGKARRLLGWEAAHDLEAGLAACVDWVRRHDAEIPW